LRRAAYGIGSTGAPENVTYRLTGRNMAVLGIDIGTTGSRALVLDELTVDVLLGVR
jgi:hypothetical protein